MSDKTRDKAKKEASLGDQGSPNNVRHLPFTPASDMQSQAASEEQAKLSPFARLENAANAMIEQERQRVSQLTTPAGAAPVRVASLETLRQPHTNPCQAPRGWLKTVQGNAAPLAAEPRSLPRASKDAQDAAAKPPKANRDQAKKKGQ